MSEEKKEKKAPAKKATTAKKTATKATAKKTATKTAAKKPATKVAKTAKAATKTATKKTTTKTAAKTTAKKTAAKTTTKKATTAKKSTTKATTKKAATKATTKKAPAKKTTRAKRTGLKLEEPVVEETVVNEVETTPVEVPAEAPLEATSTNEFGTTTISAEVSQAYVQQPVVETKTEVKNDTVSQEEKKARKGGRKVIVTMVVVIILAIAAFLGLWYFSKITAHNKIVDTLDKLKAGDQATEVELIDLTNTLGLEAITETNTDSISDLVITNNEENTDTTSVTNEILQQSKKDEKDYIDFFKKMEYEIVEEKADFVDGYVKVKIVNKNIGKIIKKYYVRAFSYSIKSAFSTQQSTNVQKKLDEYLTELLTSDEIERVATEVTFKLKREGFEWKLDVNKEELCDAILPGLREQLKDFEF